MFRYLTLLVLCCSALFANAQEVVKISYPKCAHCTPMSLVPKEVTTARVEAIPFNTGNDALTALVSKSVDVALLTYIHYAVALDKGFDVVAISGQINGGLQILSSNDISLAAEDWEGLKRKVAQYKENGRLLKVGTSRGNAVDIGLRGAFAKQGIDVNKDVQFVNIPNFADHLQALRRGEIDMVSTVEPFATQILQANGAKFFTLPYDHAAGKLTNLLVTRSDFIAKNPSAVEAIVRAVIKVNEKVGADSQLFADTISSVTGLDKAIAAGAVRNLYPDFKIHRASAVAIAKMMRELKYVNNDVSSVIEKNIDYRFLEAATGKKKSELGF